MKTTTFALALTAFAVLTTASAQIAQVRSDQLAPVRGGQASDARAELMFTVSEAEIGSLSIRASSGNAGGGLVARNGGSGGGAGKASFSDLSLMLHVNKATPMLAKMCAAGRHFPKSTLTVRKAGGDPKEYYKVVMYDVVVSSYQFSPNSGGDRPMESLSLNFAKIEWDYRSKSDR